MKKNTKKLEIVSLKEAGTFIKHKFQYNPAQITHLVIKGKTNVKDFFYIRDNLIHLEELNLEGTLIEANNAEGCYPECYDNEIPDYAFYKEEGRSLIFLRKIILPQNLKAIGMHAFRECTVLNEIEFPQTLIIIDDYPLNGSFKLASTTQDKHSKKISTLKISSSEINNFNEMKFIKRFAFFGCKFTNLFLPEGVIRIENSAFTNCDKLERIILPKTLQEIERYAFAGCINLKEIINYNPIPQSIDFDVFEYVNRERLILRVPFGSENKYENHDSWGIIENIKSI